MPHQGPDELSNTSEGLHKTVEAIYRSESGRILAGDLDVAEEAMHEAWPLPWTHSLGPECRRIRAPSSGASSAEETPDSLFYGAVLTVREVGALPNFDDVAVRIADVAAYLAVLWYRWRDELRSPALP